MTALNNKGLRCTGALPDEEHEAGALIVIEY
jgi:hypothetical protein